MYSCISGIKKRDCQFFLFFFFMINVAFISLAALPMWVVSIELVGSQILDRISKLSAHT